VLLCAEGFSKVHWLCMAQVPRDVARSVNDASVTVCAATHITFVGVRADGARQLRRTSRAVTVAWLEALQLQITLHTIKSTSADGRTRGHPLIDTSLLHLLYGGRVCLGAPLSAMD
jgi:hypothetical protein